MLTPRPDLSGGGREVIEFRIKAHDGQRLWGLLARPTWSEGPWPAHIRSVGPAERPEVDPAVAEDGFADLIFQEPAGRRLEDRVLDVVRICRLAWETDGIDRLQVSFSCPEKGREPDEFLIAEQLLGAKLG